MHGGDVSLRQKALPSSVVPINHPTHEDLWIRNFCIAHFMCTRHTYTLRMSWCCLKKVGCFVKIIYRMHSMGAIVGFCVW